MVAWMPLLVGLLIYLELPDGQPAVQEVVYGIGINQCNAKCIQRGSCMSFAFDTDRLACHLSSKDAKKWTLGRLSIYTKKKEKNPGGACSTMECELHTRCVERRGGGAVCVEEGHTVSSTLESSCLSDSDCSALRKFVCFTKTCKCIPGFSFNLANNSCVRRCKEYGGEFTTYRGLTIKDNNDKIFTSVSPTTCAKKCIEEKSFFCLTYEVVGFACYLSQSGFLDVPTSQQEKEGNYFVMATRNCA